MILTYNTRLLFSSQKDKTKVLKTLEGERLAFNEASKECFKLEKNSIVLLHSAFYRKFRNANPKIPSQVAIRGEQACLSAYKSTKANKQYLAVPSVKDKLAMRLDKRLYTYKNDELSLTTIDKRIKCRLHIYPKLQELLLKYPFCDPLVFERNGEIWIALTFKIQDPLVNPTKAIGVDLGIRRAFATSDGNIFIDRKFNAEKRRLRYLKRQLASKGTKSARRHLRKLSRKERNKNNAQTHKLANAILSNKSGNTIVLEDMNVVKLKAKKHKFQNKNRISQVPFGRLRDVIIYKAPKYGKTVKLVNPSYTSQIDHATGLKGERRGCRFYGAKIYDADVNAAINIGLRSKLPVSIGNYLDGQALVNEPNVCKSIIKYGIISN